MSIELDPQEVLEHLYSLGYYNITKEQLKEFINDLKKLIKYDLRNQERKYHQEIFLKSNKENAHNIIPVTPTKYRCSPQKISTSTLADVVPRKTSPSCTCSHHPHISIKSLSKSAPSNQLKIPHDSPQPLLGVSSSTCSKCHHPLNVIQTHSKPDPQDYDEETDAGSTSDECCTEPDRQNTQRKKKGISSSIKKQASSLKPCPSFIRPSSAKGKPPKGDPVALYHFYKSLWSQHTLPGENSHEDLRWRIRHRMMAPPVLTKGQSEEKVPKRPDWVPS